jgi:hypothetical protein
MGILHLLLAFPEQPGEFLMGRYGIHVPLCTIQADNDAGDISSRTTDTVIQPPGVGRHHHAVDGYRRGMNTFLNPVWLVSLHYLILDPDRVQPGRFRGCTTDRSNPP